MFDEIARKSSRSGENSSTKENKLTIPCWMAYPFGLYLHDAHCSRDGLFIQGMCFLDTPRATASSVSKGWKTGIYVGSDSSSAQKCLHSASFPSCLLPSQPLLPNMDGIF